MNAFNQAFRYCFHRPGFSLIVVLTLSLGIGAATAIFSVVHAVLLEPLPFADSDRIMTLWHRAPGVGFDQIEQSDGTYQVYRESSHSFEEIGRYENRAANITGGGEPIRLNVAVVSRSFFDVLGTRPFMGSLWDQDAQLEGGPQVALISHHLWRQRYGSDREIVGKPININGRPRTIAGVLPPGFHFPQEETQIWTPYTFDPDRLGRLNFYFNAIGKLRPGVSIQEAEQELAALLAEWPERYPGEIRSEMLEQTQTAPFLVPLREWLVGHIEQALWIIMGTAFFVLLIACANVANLFLVRAEGQQRDTAIRTALGARWSHLAVHFLSESLLLSSLGGGLGILLAFLAVRLLVWMEPGSVPRLDQIHVNAPVLIFALCLTLAGTLVFGAVPILRRRKTELASTLSEGGRTGSWGHSSLRSRNILVVSQVALALVLLAGSGLMFRSFHRMSQIPLGFSPEDLLTVRLTLTTTEYNSAEAVGRFYFELLDHLRGLPGVESVGAVDNLPLAGVGNNNGLEVESRPVGQNEIPPVVKFRRTMPGYFKTLQIPLLEGRLLEKSDFFGGPGVALLSQALAEAFFPGESAIGKRVRPYDASGGSSRPWFPVVGVVGDVHDQGISAQADQIIYFPTMGPATNSAFGWTPTMSLVLRSPLESEALAGAVRNAVWRMDRNLPIANVQTARELIARTMSRTTFTLVLLGIASMVALVLGAVGLYGVISYMVGQRRREIAIRMALGARTGNVKWMVVARALSVTLVGIAIGAVSALFLSQSLRAILYEISPLDPLTHIVVAVVLLAVSLLAAYLPARRAARTDPVQALRSE